MKVAIIGGGVIGLCCAYYLDKQDYKVVVIDRNDITDGCSFGNMGYISPSHFIPLASPGIIRQGLKWMLSSSSPFYIQPRLNLDLIRWGLTFRKNANEKKVHENIPHLNDLLQLSRKLMNDLKTEFHDSFDMIERGCWALFKNPKTADHEKHLAEQASKLGLKTEICNAQEVQVYEPEVEVDVAGGVLWLDDCHLNSSKFMKSLHAYLKDRGVEFLLNTEVTNFERKNGNITSVVTDKAKVDAVTGQKNLKFIGFDGNHEDHFGIARYFVEDLKRWGRFKGRDLNSHTSSVDGYRRILRVFEPMRSALGDRSPLNADEIARIMNARRR